MSDLVVSLRDSSSGDWSIRHHATTTLDRDGTLMCVRVADAVG